MDCPDRLAHGWHANRKWQTGWCRVMDPDRLLGYPVRRWTVTLGGRHLEILGPADEDDLLDSPEVARRFEQDEYLPYWGQLWPAAVMLAEEVLDDEPGRNRPALEIGCGLGLVAIAARLAGWDVLATDYDKDALGFTRENARCNGVPSLPVKLVDWRRPRTLDRFDRLFASDVLYEHRHQTQLADTINLLLAQDGLALVSDPNRKTAQGFEDALRHVGLACRTSETHANQPHGRYVKGTIYRIWR